MCFLQFQHSRQFLYFETLDSRLRGNDDRGEFPGAH
jgi:hypothetical protein